MSLSSTYLSVKELLANNLTTKGVSASTSEGLTTLSNKVLSIPTNTTTKIKYTATDLYSPSSSFQASDWQSLSVYVDDGSTGTSSYTEIQMPNGESAIQWSVSGWSRHEILDIGRVYEAIDLKQPFFIQADFYIQDGFENPGIFVTNDKNDQFYQIFMCDNGGFYTGYGNDRIHKIVVGKNKYIVPDRMNAEDSEIINIYAIHRMKIIFIDNKLIFEFKALNDSFEECESYSYTMNIDNFVPTQAGIELGYKGSYDGGGNITVFNNVKLSQIE